MQPSTKTRWTVWTMTGSDKGLSMVLRGEYPSRAQAAASLRTLKGRVMRDQANQAYYAQTSDKTK